MRRHRDAYGSNPIYQTMLDVGGDYAFRLRGEDRLVWAMVEAMAPPETAFFRDAAAHLEPGGVAVVEPWLSPESFRPGMPRLDVAEAPGLKVARMGRADWEGFATGATKAGTYTLSEDGPDTSRLIVGAGLGVDFLLGHDGPFTVGSRVGYLTRSADDDASTAR